MSQNYKETLNLPKTDFPMKAGLATREPEILRKWEESGLYEQIQTARTAAELFVLHDGPPFANGDVHMGTALNKILKDLVVKSKTMAGFRAPFVPGWDCHGLPIEYKVVKETRGLPRSKCGSDRRRLRANSSTSSARNSSASASSAIGSIPTSRWTRPTKPRSCAPSPSSWRKGWFINRRSRSSGAPARRPRWRRRRWNTRTARTPAVYVKFPIVTGPLAGKASIVIWTTTPWTLPANLAIAVHPKERYVAQKFTNGEDTETLVLAEKLLPQFRAATGLL